MSERLNTLQHQGLTFDIVDEGPLDGTPVLLLHGFPESALAWSAVQPLLHEAGLRTIAPNLRGYSPGARPTERSAYRLSVLCGDVLAMLDALGLQQGHIVGHDWGAGLAWELAMRHPSRVASLTTASTPHTKALEWAIRHNRSQLRRSWYMFAMQAPWLAERAMARMIRTGGLERLGLDPEHAKAYAALHLQPGALTGPINWYRGMFATSSSRWPGARPEAAYVDTLKTPQAYQVRVPTTLVWGRNDPHLGREAAQRTAQYCVNDYKFVELDADHWLPEGSPAELAAEIISRVNA